MKAYITAYPKTLYIKFAKQYLHEQTLLTGDLTDLDYFVRTYPEYPDEGKMWRYFYEIYTKENGRNSVIYFLKQYPAYPYKEELRSDYAAAKIHQEKPIYDAALKSKKSSKIVQFIQQFPDSELVKEAENTLADALLKDGSFKTFQFFLKQYPKSPRYYEIIDKLYDEYTKDGEFFSVNQFMIDYPEYQNTDKLKEGLKIGQKGKEIILAVPFDPAKKKQFEEYIRIAAPSERAFIALQRMIENDLANQNWSAALTTISQFESYFAKNPKVANLKMILQAKNLGIQKQNLGDLVNTKMDEYVPIISVDNQYLYFCRWDETNENIYVSKKENGQWKKATYVEGLNVDKPRENEGSLSISADNNEIIIFKNGDLYSAKKNIGGWQAAKAFGRKINTDRWEADAMLSSDGKALIFSSKRNDLMHLDIVDTKDYHGDEAGNADLFVALKDTKGKWQTPINLGDIINTPFLERTPFLHSDMKTLYFSSDGHGGLGRLDVYKTTRLDDSWTNWSVPVNLGKGINTPENDWGYKVSTDGIIAYFEHKKDNENGQDLYRIILPESLRPEKVSIISGKIHDINGNPVFADVVWEDLESGQEIGRLKSNPTTGTYFITLPNEKSYSYFIEKKGYLPQANHIDLRKKNNPINIQESISINKVTEMIDRGQKTPLKNLFFEPNRFTIKKASFWELNRLAKIIKKYQVKTEISGHTDSNGDTESNLILSQNRAKAVKDYLIQQGCDADDISVQGFGYQQPLDDNTTEDGRKKNRRVEVRFML